MVFGFTVCESFESPAVVQTGVVPTPKSVDRVVGGHAVVPMGDSDAKARSVRNSWGSSWVDGGYFYRLFPYLTGTSPRPDSDQIYGAHLASDFWALELVS